LGDNLHNLPPVQQGDSVKIWKTLERSFTYDLWGLKAVEGSW
jgi:hypothetical protein